MYTLIHKLFIVIGDIEYVLSPAYKHPFRKKLFLDYIRIRIKMSLCRWFHFNHEHFLSYTVLVPDYNIFFAEFRQIFIRHTYYAEVTQENPFIIDCGGNIGMSVLYWKYLFPTSKVVVFEPSHEVFDFLMKNIEANALADVKVVRAAVGSTEGEADMYMRGTAAAGNTLKRTILDSTPMKHEIVSYPVKIVRLSTYMTMPVDILKLDIEGNEGSVLQEVSETGKFKQVRQCIMEYHYYPTTKDNALTDILSIFTSHGLEAQFYFEEYKNDEQFGLSKYGSYAISVRSVCLQ